MKLEPEKVGPCTGFSIVIPTWCNRDFLRICLDSIEKNSALKHEVLLHINDGSDGTREEARRRGLVNTASPENIGICYAVNQAAARATKEWILYLNDDMYCCPGWDLKLAERLESIGHDACMLSATMIEPISTRNTCVRVADFGRTPEGFNEAGLLSQLSSLARADWCGSTWPPSVVHRRWWNAVGGLSAEFSPGMSSDNDFSMKMWHAGCRIFQGVGDSLVYHFISKSTGKVVKNNGRQQFLKKWGLPQSAFDRYFLRRGQPLQTSALPEPEAGLGLAFEAFRARLKMLVER